MALPKLNTPTYELELPSTAEKIKYRPFLVKEQKVLMMAQESNDETQVANAMGNLVSSCTFGSVDPNKSPMFDLEYVFLKIRGKSVGETVKLNLICPDDEKTNVSVDLKLDDIEVQMDEEHSNEINISESVKVVFRYPLLTDMVGSDKESTDIAKVFHFLTNCIHEIHYGDDVYRTIDLKKSEIEEFIDEFTGEQFEMVTNFFNSMPKLRHTIEVTNPKTKIKSEVLLEGLESFLG